MALLISATVFIGVACFFFSLQLREQERAGFADDRLKRATGRADPRSYRIGGGAPPLRGSRVSRSQALASMLAGFSLTANLERQLNRSDWHALTVSDFLLISAVTAVLPMAIVFGVTGALWIAIGVGLVGLFAPRLLLARNTRKRQTTFNEQLVEVLTHVANSLRAGFGLLQAVAQAADEAKPPIATELQETLRDIQLGASIEDAFKRLDARVGSDDLDIVITAILVQRGAGGSLAEIIEGVGHTMRERVRIRGEINTLTTQGKYTGYLIGILPIILAGGFFLVNRSYEELLFTTNLGHFLLAVWGIMQLTGLLVIRKILSIEI